MKGKIEVFVDIGCSKTLADEGISLLADSNDKKNLYVKNIGETIFKNLEIKDIEVVKSKDVIVRATEPKRNSLDSNEVWTVPLFISDNRKAKDEELLKVKMNIECVSYPKER